MSRRESHTKKIIQLIGSPFSAHPRKNVTDTELLEIYDQAFEDRVAPLYLSIYRRDNWDRRLQELYEFARDREEMTLTVLSDLGQCLSSYMPNGYVIFKSIKPYPAIPNDTDVIIFGSKREFRNALEHLRRAGYIFHEWAPMQTTFYDPRGIGKVGKGKKGGIYYIDIYENISTDYVCYLDKRVLLPYVIVKDIRGKKVNLLSPEPELAIILFHNLFPERTYQLEHFYMPLYYLSKPDFDIEKFRAFVEKHRLTYAVKTNLSLIEALHLENFGSVPPMIENLLNIWGRNEFEVERFKGKGMSTPYMFSHRTFWITCIQKLRDPVFFSSVIIQSLHMLNPFFLVDVLQSLRKRLSARGTYHLE